MSSRYEKIGSGTERKARGARGAGTPDLTITKRSLYHFHHRGAVRRPSDFGVSAAGGQHCSTADYIAGQSFPLAVTVLPGLRKPGHGSAHDARRAAPVDRVWESGPRRGRDLARVRVLNKPSDGARPAQHSTAFVGYQWTSNLDLPHSLSLEKLCATGNTRSGHATRQQPPANGRVD